MKTLLSLFLLFSALPAFANEILLTPGSSTMVRAGQDTLVTCGGGGHHGRRRERCECVLDNTICRGARFQLIAEGVKVWESMCMFSEHEAYLGSECLEQKKKHPACR